MKLYGGIDLYSNNVVVALIDEQDRVVYQRRLPNELGLILGELEPFSDGVEGLVVESTFNWYWLVDGLQAAGYRVHLANTAAIKQYTGLKYTDDRSDAAPTPAGLRTCCGSGSCPRGISTRGRHGRCGTSCASAASWYASAPRTY